MLLNMNKVSLVDSWGQDCIGVPLKGPSERIPCIERRSLWLGFAFRVSIGLMSLGLDASRGQDSDNEEARSTLSIAEREGGQISNRAKEMRILEENVEVLDRRIRVPLDLTRQDLNRYEVLREKSGEWDREGESLESRVSNGQLELSPGELTVLRQKELSTLRISDAKTYIPGRICGKRCIRLAERNVGSRWRPSRREPMRAEAPITSREATGRYRNRGRKAENAETKDREG